MGALADNYSAAPGTVILGGRVAVPTVQPFNSVRVHLEGSGTPDATDNGKLLVVELHGSGGANLTTGRQYRGDVTGTPMEYDGYTEVAFSVVKPASVRLYTGCQLLRPVEKYGNYPDGKNREGMYLGFKRADGRVHLSSHRMLDAMMLWNDQTLTMYDQEKRCLTGDSMGSWGCLNYALRRPGMFAAIYPDRPRTRYNETIGNFAVAEWASGLKSVPAASMPLLADVDGGGSVVERMDHIAYVLNPANDIPPILWNVGWDDGFTRRSDHVDFVAAMRATKRVFAFAWNNGNHTTGSIQPRLLRSYPWGTYSRGKGCPLFTEHSRDGDPAIDLEGGINLDLGFQNVAESASSWSCEVTSVAGACTVKVEPKSKVFTAQVEPVLVNIPEAGSGLTGAGSTTTAVQLDASSSSAANAYVGNTLYINNEVRMITAYNSATKVATLGAVAGYVAALPAAPAEGVAYAIGKVWVAVSFNA